MNLTPEDLDRVLADLAPRADLHRTPDRVPAVHRRIRRAARARAAGAAATVAMVVAILGAALGPGRLPFLRGDEEMPAVPSVTMSAYLTVALTRDDVTAAGLAPRPGATAVVVQVTLAGLVPQLSDAAGRPATLATDNLLGLEMNWDDGTLDRAVPQYDCVPGAALVPVDTHLLMTHYYARPGTYTITYRTGACDPVGTATRTLTVTVP